MVDGEKQLLPATLFDVDSVKGPGQSMLYAAIYYEPIWGKRFGRSGVAVPVEIC